VATVEIKSLLICMSLIVIHLMVNAVTSVMTKQKKLPK